VKLYPFFLAAFVGIASAQTRGENPQAVFERAVSDFERGRVVESAAGFDNLIKLVPDSAPQLWQRGIALYYAGRYKDCRAQFESHRTVNPNDVENAVWHFLCVTRESGVEKARADDACGVAGEDAARIGEDELDAFGGAARIGHLLIVAISGGSLPAGVVWPDFQSSPG